MCAVIPKVLLISLLGSFLIENVELFNSFIIPIKFNKVLGSSRLKLLLKFFHFNNNFHGRV